jgi:hypothetical protein
LSSAEAELQRLQAGQIRAPIVARIAQKVGERFLALLGRLEEPLGRDAERSRSALVEAIGPKITLEPDESGRFLWAEYGLEGAELQVAVGMPVCFRAHGLGGLKGSSKHLS